MQNLDQIRADNALMACGQQPVPAGRAPVKPVTDTAVNRLPALIVNNGLLATAAFAEKKGDELLCAMDAVAWHLADSRVGRLPTNRTTTRGLTEHLIANNSQALRLAAAEALNFLTYLKRYAS
ncbi:MAG: type III-B CRISPR module-associated protein Cmr5 [Verrucomicrobia bacterium]|nr:type III-B CRISPR module-associated protein Cmr5 [Verrucomicrobiota bacterium]